VISMTVALLPLTPVLEPPGRLLQTTFLSLHQGAPTALTHGITLRPPPVPLLPLIRQRVYSCPWITIAS
jgi:hypothetical protein